MACQEKFTLLCEELLFHILYSPRLVYVLLVISANGYPSCFGAQECGLEAWCASVVVRLQVAWNGVYQNWCVAARVMVADDLAPDCSVTS